jgi:transcriptional regulator GlxA family with amidase domain
MDARVAAVIALMRQSGTNRLSVRDLSRKVNLSPTRMRQLFKQEIGRSPLQYIRAPRVQQAEHLLRSTFLCVKEIAFLSGGKDASHFVREFKRTHGLTPSQFRARWSAISECAGRAETTF